MTTFTDRFSERKVGRWVIGYLAGAWVGLQVLQLLWEVFEWPLTPLRVLVGVLALGFPVVVTFAWVRRAPRADPSAPVPTSGRRHRVRTVSSVVVAVLILAGIGWTANRSFDRLWARGEAVVEVGRLADAGEYATALEVGERALQILPGLAVLDSLVDETLDWLDRYFGPPG